MGDDPHAWFGERGIVAFEPEVLAATVVALMDSDRSGEVVLHRPPWDPRSLEFAEVARALIARRRVERGGEASWTSRQARCSRSASSTSGTGGCRCCSGSTWRSRPGEAVAVLGTNGAGKTTLLRALSGLVSPTARLDRARRRRPGPHERGGPRPAGRRAGARRRRVPRPHRRREPARPRWSRTRRSGATPASRIDRVYDVFPALAAHRRQDAASLSGGEQQMVALGCALLFEPAPAAGRRAVARVSRRSSCSA